MHQRAYQRILTVGLVEVFFCGSMPMDWLTQTGRETATSKRDETPILVDLQLITTKARNA